MKPNILIVGFVAGASLLPLGASAAIVVYNRGNAPEEINAIASPYHINNPYLKSNPNHPYSDLHNPYHPYSFRNNQETHASPALDFEENIHGTISIQNKTQNALNNLYAKHGNRYIHNNILNAYSTQNGNYSYTYFRNPFDEDSVYKSDVYSLKIYNQRGQFAGTLNIYRAFPHSAVNPYTVYGNPYSHVSIYNPYHNNPYK
jgi:hypothetical protein